MKKKIVTEFAISVVLYDKTLMFTVGQDSSYPLYVDFALGFDMTRSLIGHLFVGVFYFVLSQGWGLAMQDACLELVQ
jgi:hypothetical protein